MKSKLRIGTSGWVYPHWQGVFYPDDLPTSEWFAYYAECFSTVEINNTFYQLPSEEVFLKWRDGAPPGFLFAVKANRYLTHMKKLKDAQEPLERFLGRARLLGNKLGPILYQLPPNWKCNPDRLRNFLSLLPNNLLHVIEFRDQSWLNEEVFNLLAEYQAAFCIVSMPDFPRLLRTTAPLVYIRMHGSEALYRSCYKEGELKRWAERIKGFLSEGRDVYVYFNNDTLGYAVRNARRLREILEASQ